MNPWNVPNIQEFQFFCCPECDSKVKNSQDFINHALLLHEEAKDSLEIAQSIVRRQDGVYSNMQLEVLDDLEDEGVLSEDPEHVDDAGHHPGLHCGQALRL